MLRTMRFATIIRQEASVIAAKRALEVDVGVQGDTVVDALVNLCEAMELRVEEEQEESGPRELARRRVRSEE
jgi:predicted RNase H-like HicB family nuclease